MVVARLLGASSERGEEMLDLRVCDDDRRRPLAGLASRRVCGTLQQCLHCTDVAPLRGKQKRREPLGVEYVRGCASLPHNPPRFALLNPRTTELPEACEVDDAAG